jgi:hypothetical protein
VRRHLLFPASRVELNFLHLSPKVKKSLKHKEGHPWLEYGLIFLFLALGTLATMLLASAPFH